MSKDESHYLDRQMLEDMGIIAVIPNGTDYNDWTIVRRWYRNNSKTIIDTKPLAQHVFKGKAKYVEPKEYIKVQFSYKNETQGICLHRLLWAWWRGPIPEGMEIGHQDDNTFNNYLNPFDNNDPKNNLYLTTVLDNRRKRWVNPNNHKNQWDCMDDFDKCVDTYMRHARKRRKQICQSLERR